MVYIPDFAMAFSESDKYNALKHLNFQVQRNLILYSMPGYSAFTAKLNPEEYQGAQPQPLYFTEASIFAKMEALDDKTYIVQQVQTILERLDTLEENLFSEQSSANGALIKADVLEWSTSAGSRTEGMLEQRENLCEQLRYFLGLPPTPNTASGSASVVRS